MKNVIKALSFAAAVAVFLLPNAHGDSTTKADEPAVKSDEPAVFVAGGVKKPGSYIWSKGMTLADAVKAAGGLADSSVSTTRVTITHADHTQVAYPFTPGNDAKKSPPLQSGDRVFVAKNLKSPPVPTPSPKPGS